jgi:DNA-directed RNA polymerase subunit RPC12/RpoP
MSTTNESTKRPIACPYCDSTETELFSLYGNSLLSSQYVCRNCHTVFDVVRFDGEESEQYPVISQRNLNDI